LQSAEYQIATGTLPAGCGFGIFSISLIIKLFENSFGGQTLSHVVNI